MTSKVSYRRCVGCFKEFPQNDLIRVVRTLPGEVFVEAPDAQSKTSGRGVYLCSKDECFTRASKQRGKKTSLSHGLKMVVDESVLGKIREVLEV
ncbi:MAG: YlxR family protein [Candidatus Peregrinibacteria bacterium]|nr:YlxR family protein [Candidatus Peregrinibacteria bacterium]